MFNLYIACQFIYIYICVYSGSLKYMKKMTDQQYTFVYASWGLEQSAGY